MAVDKDTKWIYSKDFLEKTPSRKDGIDAEKELSYRQQAANLIQDMGQRLSVNQLTINTAIVYMHRFYVYHSYAVFSRYAIAPTALFLAAKVEEQPKKLEHVLKICHACLHPDKPHLDTHSEPYLKQAQELVQNELVLLQTLGFDISVDHPHTHVVKCTQLVKASRDLSQMAYFMATNSLHLTKFCLLYKPTVVAAMCIHLSCKWSNYEIPLSSDGKAYWAYMDPSISESLLDTIISEFLKILNRCPTRLRKLKNYRPAQSTKADGESRQDASSSKSSNSQQGHSRAQVPSSATVKEKKPTMSIEEYKRTRPPQQTKSSHPLNKPPPPSHTGAVKKTDSHGPPSHSSHDISRTSHAPPHHSQPKPNYLKDFGTKPSHPFHKAVNESHKHVVHDNKPGPGSDRVKANEQQHNKNMMKPQPPGMEKKHVKPIDHQKPSKPHSNIHHPVSNSLQQKHVADSDDTPAEILVVSKDLEGRIQSEKLLQNVTAESAGHYRSGTHPAALPHHSQRSNNNSVAKDNYNPNDSSRHHHSEKLQNACDGRPVELARRPHDQKIFPGESSHEHSGKNKFQLDSKRMIEMYRKHPDKLKSLLKHKAQSSPLTLEEKNIYAKLQAKEEEKRRRKAAENQAKMKLHSKTPAVDNESHTTHVDSPAGPLTLRIKLGPKPVESGTNTSVAKIVGSSSGSGSEASPVPSRKRALADPAGHTTAKHSRRSEDRHNHSGGNGSSSGNGTGKQKHHSKHPSKSGKHNEPIAEAVFQKSLSDAITKVQQAGGSGVPTVTLKRASNGKESNFFSSASLKQDFDPTAPVSAQMPDEIFEEENDGGTRIAPHLSRFGSLVSYDSSQSTPEPGEIKDESPPYIKGRPNHSTQKASGLFSPPIDSGMQHVMPGYGYSGQSETGLCHRQ
ncbi:unnamed protein product [Clavelina lepadiformis]|uniref:Cyclin-like domain-containing protein n=1 Tax=Clavelina lepadiformis TaxID=159417 RepID=A0ABP0EYX1_CLALP